MLFKKSELQKDQKGFTIIELMIATFIFAVIVLLVTGAIIQIGRSYNKGATSTRTQEAARRITDDIQQSIIFSASPPVQDNTAGKAFVCIGDRQYNYVRGRQVTGSNWGLIVKSGVNGCGSATAVSSSALRPNDFTELLGPSMRLSNFTVTSKGGNYYQITVRVVSGESDLLCADGAVGGGAYNCDSTVTFNSSEVLNNDGLRCKNTKAGNEFCAMSELSTLVTQRL